MVCGVCRDDDDDGDHGDSLECVGIYMLFSCPWVVLYIFFDMMQKQAMHAYSKVHCNLETQK